MACWRRAGKKIGLKQIIKGKEKGKLGLIDWRTKEKKLLCSANFQPRNTETTDFTCACTSKGNTSQMVRKKIYKTNKVLAILYSAIVFGILLHAAI